MRLTVTRRDLVVPTLWLATTDWRLDHCLGLDQALELIQSQCPRAFRAAVMATGNFLYRGEAAVNCPMVLNPEPDLLRNGTYPDDPQAIVYFTELEYTLRHHRVRPSTSHLVTAAMEDAAAWGTPVSVWPLGQSLSYLWPRHGQYVYPGPGPRRLYDFVINQGMDVALRRNKEIMFTTSNAKQQSSPFLAIPSRYDAQVWQLLHAQETLFYERNVRR